MANRYSVTHTFFLLRAQTRPPTICRSQYLFRHITKKIPRNPGLLIAQRKLRDIHPGTFVSELSTSLNNIQVIMHPTSCQCKIGNRTLHQRPLTNLWAASSNEPNGSQNRKQSPRQPFVAESPHCGIEDILTCERSIPSPRVAHAMSTAWSQP